VFGFMPDVLEQLEPHMHIGLLSQRREDAGCQLGHGFLRRKAGDGVEQAPDCRSTFLFGTARAERQQLAK